jgi:hypothetical protein
MLALSLLPYSLTVTYVDVDQHTLLVLFRFYSLCILLTIIVQIITI